MKNPVHPFDPSLSELFLQQFNDSSVDRKIEAIDSRQLFYQLNQAQQNSDIIPCAYDFITQGLKEVKCVYSSLIIDGYKSNKLASLQVSTIDPIADHLLTQDNLNTCINQTAAILLTQPSWLQNSSPTAFSQTKTSVQLMSLFLQLTRTEGDSHDLRESYRSLLLAIGTNIPVLHSYVYSQQSNIITETFDFASIQLALAQFPRVLLPEILGFSLSYCQMPTVIEICFPNHQLTSPFFEHHHLQTQQQLAPLKVCITNYLDLFPRQQQHLWLRVQYGFWLYHQQMQRCRDKISNTLTNPLSPQQAVLKLFNQKKMAAIGHHQKIQLKGVSLDKWFSEMPSNSQAFLHALKQSNFVDRQKPENSALLKLFAFKGPMFGVLNEDELEIVKNWLINSSNEGSINCVDEIKKIVTDIAPSVKLGPTNKYAKLNNRELYYYLINADLFPDVLPFVKHKARRLLQLTTYLNRPPFKHYNHDKFDSYIKNLYQHEIEAYHPLQGKPKISRDAYVWGIEQIAPMILIDGCWLQNSLMLQKVNPEICGILFSIYCDEIGNGKLEQNHPYIFQQLLDSLSIRLPSVHSKEFTKHSGFINSAFDLPVYMLSLSYNPVEFMPELLGLNMAIELSGLGKSYLGLVDEWNYWGIDPTIANIHITIDNYASGHTFLAKKAIQLYMDEVMQTTGSRTIINKHWRRIHSGYASLRFIGTLFKLGLPIGYLIHKFKHKLNL